MKNVINASKGKSFIPEPHQIYITQTNTIEQQIRRKRLCPRSCLARVSLVSSSSRWGPVGPRPPSYSGDQCSPFDSLRQKHPTDPHPLLNETNEEAVNNVTGGLWLCACMKGVIMLQPCAVAGCGRACFHMGTLLYQINKRKCFDRSIVFISLPFPSLPFGFLSLSFASLSVVDARGKGVASQVNHKSNVSVTPLLCKLCVNSQGLTFGCAAGNLL